MTVVNGPIRTLARTEAGPSGGGRSICGAITTPAYRSPAECGLPAGHPGGHMAANNYVWAVRDWEA